MKPYFLLFDCVEQFIPIFQDSDILEGRIPKKFLGERLLDRAALGRKDRGSGIDFVLGHIFQASLNTASKRYNKKSYAVSTVFPLSS